MKKWDNHTFVVCAYKESDYLEECIESLENQMLKSQILIATSTPNEHITEIAKKHGLKVYENHGEKGIAGDWNFAYHLAGTAYVTLAHQDDLYDKTYLSCIREGVSRSKNPLILFTDYYEVRDGKEVHENQLLKVKRMLLAPLKIKRFQSSRWMKRRILSFGNPICCPAVTYHKKELGDHLFRKDFASNLDWQTWELISGREGQFVYIPREGMAHRIHEESTTSQIIGDNKRAKEDYEVMKKFWPAPIAKVISGVYKNSEKSNNV